ncbi:hypothetical protein [Nocardia abscessus]|uniref:hypothetical protein n=1 Tax=Nocardia abscessus TaxID=120957 RepID=UPI00245770A9|nr:hypothetical protein [Nocardia abscessus]
MVRFADRKQRIRTLMEMYPGISYGEASRRDQLAVPSKSWEDWPEPEGPEAEITRRCSHRRIQQLLTDTLHRLDRVPPASPPVIRLAHCYRGFVAAGYVSERLHWWAVVPTDDFYSTVHRACQEAAGVLESAVGPHLARKYWPGRLLHGPDMFEHLAWMWAGLDVDFVTEPLTAGGLAIRRVLVTIVKEDSAPPELRHAASRTTSTAEMVHQCYGGIR